MFNVTKKPVDDPAVRKAVAQVIDRDAIAEIYKGTVHAAVFDGAGRVPGRQGVLQGRVRRSRSGEGQGDPRRGRRRDPGRARRLVHADAITAPVEADLWNEIKRQLEASGLFKVNLDSTEWDQYKEEAFAKGTYYFYGLGWFPDFPDADNYLAPFMRDGGFFQNGYSNKEVNDRARRGDSAPTTQGAREEAFGKVQDIEAEDVPLIPLWEGKQVAARPRGRRGRRQDVRPGVPVPLLAGDQEGGLARMSRTGSLRGYILIRIALMVPMVWVLLTVVFLMMRVAPGDPVSATLGGRLSPGELAERRAALGFDRPILVQYFEYLWDAVRFQFGTTITDGQTIGSILVENGGATLTLTVAALIFALVIGLPLGLIAGRYRETVPDAGIRIFAILGYAAPPFFVGLLAQLLFARTSTGCRRRRWRRRSCRRRRSSTRTS